MNQKELMRQVKQYWADNAIFQKTIEQRSDSFQIATYDGPPFASGTPHFGHGLVSAMKDALLRYKTMKGYKINRDRGWDCHGLPVEKAVEKDLGLNGKKDIEEKLGVEKFTEACRAYVGKTSDEWKTFVDYLGRWADMDHAYYTMNLEYMESVIRVFQNMYNQNLVYKGFKVQRCCPSCATTLANNEVNEGYQDRQDPAVTIKFKVTAGKNNTEDLWHYSQDGLHQGARGVIKKDGAILMLYHKERQSYSFPGGKLKQGQTIDAALKEEIAEEVGVTVTKATFLGDVKKFNAGYLFNLNIFDVEISGEPKIMEPAKHPQMVRAEIIPSDNKIGFSIKVENTIIDDDWEIIHQFYELYLYQKNIVQEIHNTDADINILAWTTTPWTLPSNMFLAVGKHIHYAMVYDKNSKEYYIIAESLLKSYYKKPDEYILINILQGEDLEGITYEPLFPFITQSKIDQKYKDQFFKVISGEFVSTEDGTGIVHMAPGFGMEDFDAVAQLLPREDAKNWLFMPVNDYGEFTDEVTDWKGVSVFDANKEVIARLKTEGKLIAQKSYNHSYPHCRRCDTPLISKAVTSRFIKEQELSKMTVPQAEKIRFVPESVKNRFIDVLKSAPDWNLSRNRYRGSPLPIWEAVTSNEGRVTSNPPTGQAGSTPVTDDRIVIGNLEELYQWGKTGSNNLTKLMFIRHGKTNYNFHHLEDSRGSAVLNDEGREQAKRLAEELAVALPDLHDTVFIISPLQRDFLTIQPYFEKIFGEDKAKSIWIKYYEVVEKYQKLFDEKKLYEYIITSGEKNRFEIGENIYVDFRTMELFLPDYQDKEYEGLSILWNDKKHGPNGESTQELYQRTEGYLLDVVKTFSRQTIVTVSHAEAALTMMKKIRDFDFDLNRTMLHLHNAEYRTFYRDNDRGTEVDLHKPYVDSYRFMKDGHTYKRVPEVMDCWFESGSMPFGQAHYLGNSLSSPSSQKSIKSDARPEDFKDFQTLQTKFVYPAEFIIEGLDQTRGRFRVLHICGNTIMKENSFNNVLINGLVLAEDGRKMSKKLNNYPDPKYIFETYGTDAYRLCLLASPAVRSEPMRFSEKAVDQIYKDFTAAIINSYNFFETYAKVDNFIYRNPTVYLLRHGAASGQPADAKLTQEAIDEMQKQSFIERVLRVNPDVIYASPFVRTQKTAERIQEILRVHRGKDIPLILEPGIAECSGKEVATYEEMVKKEAGKVVLLVSHNPTFDAIRSAYHGEDHHITMGKLDCVKLPTSPITNELDRRIFAALHEMGIELEKQMDEYSLDGGAKIVLGFVDKLNNRFIRRSRRRFRASGMDADKLSAFTTLFEVLETYMKFCAPFAPFVAEHIYLELQKFTPVQKESASVHLEHLPISSKQYINHALLDEVSLVRRIISLGLFIRSKNKIAVKQPLSKIEIKM